MSGIESFKIKEYYKTKCEDPEQNDAKAVAVTSCSRKANVPKFIQQALGLVHEDVITRAYGCCTAYPEALEGTKVLDLGSGSGRDCFVLSNLVGHDGSVVGVDMIDEALSFSKSKLEYHREKYGYSSSNVSFVNAYVEKLDEAGLEENSFDFIISNCVLNLCKDKKAVLEQAARVLKPYGEMYFSDMYRDGDLSADVMDDVRLWCEGITGSMTYKVIHDLAAQTGFTVPRLVTARELPIVDKSVTDRIGNARYAAVTYRLFKKPATSSPPPSTNLLYKGGIRGFEDVYNFDHNLQFKKGASVNVNEETASILTQSRYGKYFEGTDIQGNQSSFETIMSALTDISANNAITVGTINKHDVIDSSLGIGHRQIVDPFSLICKKTICDKTPPCEKTTCDKTPPCEKTTCDKTPPCEEISCK